MSRFVFAAAFAVGLVAVSWVGAGFVGSSPIALAMTVVIGAVYLLGALELRRFRDDTARLGAALGAIPQPLTALGDWLGSVPASLRDPVRLRIEGERVGLPGPALTPYLVGLLVMLGMLGTFLGLVLTFRGVVLALQASADLQAIRSALAAPVGGLGLAFGTSVAGVAASAVLGLLSAISRRERAAVARLLEARIAAELRPFSLVHQREETLRALQAQAQALPALVDAVKSMAVDLERRSEQLHERLRGQQEQFHAGAQASYAGLATEVSGALKDSLATSARIAGESIRPVVEDAMAALVREARTSHQQQAEAAARQVDAASRQVDALAVRFGAATEHAVARWTAALEQQAHLNDALLARLDGSLAGFAQTFDARSGALVDAVQESAARTQAELARNDQERQRAWVGALESTAGTLASAWQRMGEQTLAQQRATCDALEHTAAEIGARASEHASRTSQAIESVLSQAEDLMRSRADAEVRWNAQHAQRMDAMAALWRSELAALRHEEAQRGEAAVARLGELQAALASQLAQLGGAIEAPMARLMHTAAEVPQAAAEVLAQLRQETVRLTERDNAALHERAGLLQEIGALVRSLDAACQDQRSAIASLAACATGVLDDASGRFAGALQAQASAAADSAAHIAGGAVELASLGEAFEHGVRLFTETNEKLIDGLRRMEATMEQSMSRSDEQLAYYVAQAREVIDLSVSAQQGILEDLRRLRMEPIALTEGAV
ncbi:DUF802 domain-containing protein [Ramlibacter sp. AN1015]|uniref:DUF802 domain-containing protein n=1 Tax=Ramlibacter sp. AN1015 TaxID=3133428 RepID=UPI0030C63978